MGITNTIFFTFLTIVLLIYYVVPKKNRWIILLLSSFFFLFYDSLNISNIFFVLLILITSYITSNLICKYKNTNKANIFKIIGIVIILLILLYLKYTNFLLVTLDYIIQFFGGSFSYTLVTRVVPLGLSYYALIMIGYIIDVCREEVMPEKNIFKCALFMSYFPILTSGPFIRYKSTKEQLYEGNIFNYKNIINGLIRMLWGVFKVLVISERLSTLVTTAYSSYTGMYILIAILLYPIELYTNFSGSIDIVIGVSNMFGITLPENFNSPFYSKSITELWRRWHITLGSFLRDYLFYPLLKSKFIRSIGDYAKKLFGKKVSKKIMLYLSLFILWVVIGAWHNGAYHYILSSGILQFIYMVLEDLLSPLTKNINDNKLYNVFSILRTYLLFAISMVFFASSSVSEGINVFRNLFLASTNFNLLNLGLTFSNLIILFVSIIILLVFDKFNQDNKVFNKIYEAKTEFKLIIIGVLIIVILLFGMYGIGYNQSDFIYGNF